MLLFCIHEEEWEGKYAASSRRWQLSAARGTSGKPVSPGGGGGAEGALHSRWCFPLFCFASSKFVCLSGNSKTD